MRASNGNVRLAHFGNTGLPVVLSFSFSLALSRLKRLTERLSCPLFSGRCFLDGDCLNFLRIGEKCLRGIENLSRSEIENCTQPFSVGGAGR
jgi:hypothetical protein